MERVTKCFNCGKILVSAMKQIEEKVKIDDPQNMSPEELETVNDILNKTQIRRWCCRTAVLTSNLRSKYLQGRTIYEEINSYGVRPLVTTTHAGTREITKYSVS
jgi:DNA-directed RNA polymerase subunit N (RpoN/RPB10)